MTKQVKVSVPLKEPPLKKKTFVRKDKATGLEISVTVLSRGVLAKEISHYTLDNIFAMKPSDPRVVMETLREHLRDQLEGMGLPSDRTPRWVRPPDEEWRPMVDGDQVKPVPRWAWAYWTKRVEDQTEPLSRGRLAGDLLWSLELLLNRP